jgi:hypothetical protein
MGHTTSAATGPRLTDELFNRIDLVVRVVRYGRLTIQSDWARRCATEVSAAASLGLITTETPEGFGRVWYVTGKGIDWLEGSEL